MKQVKDAFLEVIVIFLVGGIVGSIMAVVSNLFVIAVKWLSQQRMSSNFLDVSFLGHQLSLSSMLYLWLAAACMLLIKRLFNIKKWAGPADSMYAAHQPDSPLDVKQGFASTLAAFTSLCGGASVGQYGPIVHFGATMGVVISRLQLRRRAGFARLPREVYLGCGVAAAISAGFNAPIAGIIFAHEAILRHFSVRAIAPITVASIAASSLGNYLFPQTVTFQITSAAPALAEVVPLLVILAPVFAAVAIAFMWSLRYATSTAASLNVSPSAIPFIGATICGAIGIWVPQALGLGIESVNDMISGKFTLLLLATVLIAKIIMTSACIGFGVFGGVFSPALFIGVAAGALSAQLMAQLGISNAGSVISVAAMAAVSSSVIGAPISAVLIVLELSQSYEYAVAAMIAVMVCTLITHRLFGHSFFDRQLLDRGIDLLKGREAIALEQQTLTPFASQDYVRANPVDNGEKVRSEMERRGHTEAYIIDPDGSLLGKLNIYQAISCKDGLVRDFMDDKPIILYGDESLKQAMVKVSQFVGESLPVVTKDTNQMIGSIAEGELFQAVIDVQSKARTIERD